MQATNSFYGAYAPTSKYESYSIGSPYGTTGAKWVETSPEQNLRNHYEFENEKRRLQKSYGFALPEVQSPEDRFFSAMSKYTGGDAQSSGGNYYENRLKSLIENPSNIQNSGAYRFAFDQGQQAIERSAAAKGMLNSGNILAELARYGQGMASQQYDKEADRLGQFAMQKEANDINRSAANSRNALTMMEAYNKMPRFVIA